MTQQMKMIKPILLVCFTFGLTLVHAQEDKEPDFYYEVTKNITKTGYISVEIDPLVMGFKNYYLSLGVGLGVRASNINEKFSGELKGEYNYVNYSFNSNKLGYRSIDIESKKVLNFEANFGYTLLSQKSNESRRVRMKKSGNTETVSDLPCDVIKTLGIRAGFMGNSFYQRGEAENVSPEGPNAGLSFNADNFDIFQTAYSVIIGVSRKTAVNSEFKTTKFGTIKETSDAELYGDILINVLNKFPQLNRLSYLNPTYPNEASNESVMAYQDQNTVREQFFKLPIGIRIGVRNSFYNKFGFFWYGEAGLYTGSYNKIFSAVGLKLGVGFKFQHNLN
jgi:hypothetical protein